MRFIKWFVFILIAVAIIALTVVYYLLQRSVPQYQGSVVLAGLYDEVDVHFDDYGIPVIQAQNAHDAYFALGYQMASERLFQMEMIRRVGKGELAEVIGPRALSSDVFFRTLGVHIHARKSADDFIETGSPEAVAECQSFVDGINHFIANNHPPFEFVLAGIPMRAFGNDDLFALAGYMAWSFSLAVQTDLLAAELAAKHGAEWLNGTVLSAHELGPHHPVCNPFETEIISTFPDFLGELGIPSFSGSNAWAVSGEKSASGKPLLCNDTHIGYGIPQVWYEATLVYPGFQLAGHFLPGIPYALVGHSDRHAWGLTMFENDDIDFYIEAFDDSGNFTFDLGNYAPVTREERIAIKGEKDTLFSVVSSRHGTLINGAVETLDDHPLMAMHWEFLRGRNRLLSAFRDMNRAGSLEAFERGPRNIHAPGLNVVYADADNNIAWWACARLPIRPKGVHAKLPSDGRMSGNDYQGYLPFESNPQCINPVEGFVYSANEQPEQIDSIYVAGYYVPPTRSKRIARLLSEEDQWNTAMMRSLLTDVINDDDADISAKFADALASADLETEALQAAANVFPWNGSYEIDQSAPVLFQPLQVATIKRAMLNYMSESQFSRLATTHWFRRWMIMAMLTSDHAIWDIPDTPNREQMSDHLKGVFPSVCARVFEIHGTDPQKWEWGKAHTYSPRHPFGDIPIIGFLFNANAMPIAGSNETICQAGFTPTTEAEVNARYGAQMRNIIDFSDVHAAESITPVGQSGHLLSAHYRDQLQRYASGEFRKQRLAAGIEDRHLRLVPEASVEK